MTIKKNPTLAIERLEEVVRADFEAGKLYWKTIDANRNAVVGEEAGNIGANGYRRVSIDGGLYLAHRIIWALAHRSWPSEFLDHINSQRSDDRLVNLREASVSEYRKNSAVRSDNVSGLKGASLDKRTGRYKVFIRREGRRDYLGNFKTAEEAHIVFCRAARARDGQFFNDGTRRVTQAQPRQRRFTRS